MGALKRKAWLSILPALLGAVVLLAAKTRAEPPSPSIETITFTSLLSTPDGTPLSGNYDLTFALHPSLTSASPLWVESHAGVPIERGVLSVELGGATPALGSHFDGNERFLAICLSSGAEIARVPLAATPYCICAANVLDPVWTSEQVVARGQLVVEGALRTSPGSLTVESQPLLSTIETEQGQVHPLSLPSDLSRHGQVELRTSGPLALSSSGSRLLLASTLVTDRALLASHYERFEVPVSNTFSLMRYPGSDLLDPEGVAYAVLVPANTLSLRGDSLVVEAWGLCPAEAGGEIQVDFGGQTVSLGRPMSRDGWMVHYRITHLGLGTVLGQSVRATLFGSDNQDEADTATGIIHVDNTSDKWLNIKIWARTKGITVDGWTVTKVQG